MLSGNGLIGSMGRRGNPYDNAKAESYMKTLEVETVYPMGFETFDDIVEHVVDLLDEAEKVNVGSIRRSGISKQIEGVIDAVARAIAGDLVVFP